MPTLYTTGVIGEWIFENINWVLPVAGLFIWKVYSLVWSLVSFLCKKMFIRPKKEDSKEPEPKVIRKTIYKRLPGPPKFPVETHNDQQTQHLKGEEKREQKVPL